ncbi:MAG: endolytic transglycosylase MltG [Candidatus Binatia bacterium]|nr:endolytic transglycosylase MltG [Candidatus Binatia bacterium]
MTRRILGALLIAPLLGLTAILLVVRHTLEERGPRLDVPAAISIGDGESLPAIAARMQQRGVLVRPEAFLALARWRQVDRQVRSGVYEFEGGATAGEVLEALVSGPQRFELVSIPEGWTAERIALRLEAAGLGSAEHYQELAANPDFAASLGVSAGGLEGYLFPDTYSFGDDPTPEEVLGRMTARFFEVFDESLHAAAEAKGLTPHEAITLASIVETEAAIASERPLISAVFHNRLKRGMPLQADPTVLYGVPGRTKPIRRSDLKRATPYNTYVIRGLPPGPIANPGLASLEAAVYPTKGTKALYFVARNDRSHEFNQSLSAHTRAVRKYQR